MGDIVKTIGGAAGGAGGGIGSLIGGLVGQHNASGDFQNANEAAQKAAQQLINTGMPPDLARQVVLQQYKSAGQLTPELEQAINLGPSAVANIQEDPALRQAQMGALQQYQQAGHTGQTAQDMLNNLKMQNQVNADNKSRQASILQGAQMRGQSGGGAALAAQLQSAQGDANLASEQGLQLAAQANAARMNALGQSAGLGSQLRSQDFGINQAKANAADQFQRFNVQNQQQVANQNIQAKNQAQAANLANSQQLANANVGQNNQEALRENQARLTDWQSQNQRNSIINQGQNQLAGNYTQQGNQVANQAAQMGAGIGGMLGSGMAAASSYGGGGGSGGNGFGGAQGTAAFDAGTTGNSAGGSMPEGINTNDWDARGAEMMAAHGGMAEHEGCYANGGLTLKPNPMLPPHMHNLMRPHFDQGGEVQQVPQYQPPQFPMQSPAQTTQYMQAQPQQRFMPASGVLNAQHGAIVPGHAVAPGDNYKNDMIHAMLSPDEVVIPRSIMTQHDAPERAKEFIKGLLAAKRRQR